MQIDDVRTMDYFMSTAYREIFIVRDTYSDSTIRGRLTYLYSPGKSGWPYKRVPANLTPESLPLRSSIVCNRPDDIHVLIHSSELESIFPVRRLSPNLIDEDQETKEILEALVGVSSKIKVSDFGIVGSRLFRPGGSEGKSDVDLVFYANDKTDELADVIKSLLGKGTISRVKAEDDARLLARFSSQVTYDQIAHIHRNQWFRKYQMYDGTLFNLSFASITPQNSLPFVVTDQIVSFDGIALDTKDSFSSPYTYIIQDLSTGLTRTIVTYIWLFRHCVTVGDKVKIRGKVASDEIRQFVYVNEKDDHILPSLGN